MRSKMLSAWVLILLSPLLAAGSCDSRPVSVSLFPPSVDVEAATAPKPLPGANIVTDPVARERYNAEVETWGEGLWRAGGRICRWIIDNGGTLPRPCPAPDAEPTEPR